MITGSFNYSSIGTGLILNNLLLREGEIHL